ncbi:MAG TPA: glycosyltransferase family 2 protein [Gemmataceae bacterium]|nr:glycosyltransferase family 2 protein [Gemmataceae bacterium]
MQQPTVSPRRTDCPPVWPPVPASRWLVSEAPSATAPEYDQFQRYAIAARRLERLLGGASAPVRILEVGCNVLNLLPRFLDPHRFRVKRCDIRPFACDADFILIDEKRSLPFADDAFDAVAALEVLEHLPAERRRGFLAECLRVARHGAVFTCPNGVPEVIEVERLAAAIYQQTHGEVHPFLQEHEQFGLPTEQEVVALLREFDYPHAVFDATPLDGWLAMWLAEHLGKGETFEDLQRRVNQPLLPCLLSSRGVPYRKVYVCAKTFEATAALEPEALPVSAQGRGPADAVAALQRLVSALGESLAASQAQASALETNLLAQAAELDGCRKQHLISYSLLQGVTCSRSWRLLGPLRALRRLLRPRGFDARALIPWHQLEEVPEAPRGTWRATGPDPLFFVPCLLPAGWLRLRLKMTSAVQARFEVYIEAEHGVRPAECIGRIEIRDGVDGDFYLYLPRAAPALRFDPLDVPGEFRLERLEVKPVPRLLVLLRALPGKVRQVRTRARPAEALGKALGLLLRGQFREFADRLTQGLRRPRFTSPGQYDVQAEYEAWRRRRLLTDADRCRLRRAVERMTHPPLISVLLPVYNVEEKYLRLAIESVRRQIYPHWELCITDDGSTAPHIAPVLAEYARLDPRIKVATHPSNRGIAAASNTALARATGDYIALLDHDDELAEQALFKMAQAICADRSLDMLYSDEDKLDPEGRHVEPFFKPDWSPEYFLTCMYTCHLGVYRTALVRELGGFRSEYDNAQDYDLVLRLIARSNRIHHVPDILYHWRKLPTSTAANSQAKPLATPTARRALQDYLKRIGRPGRVEEGPRPGLHRVRFDLVGRPKVSIIIPSACRPVIIRDERTYYAVNCIESIRRQSTYDHYEIILLHPGRLPAALARRLKGLGVIPLTYAEPFNFSAAMNQGAARATGEYLLFLNDDMEVISPDWLECLLEFAQQPEIGAVGARLLFPDGRLQHVGVTILDGHPGHPFYLAARDHPGYFCSNTSHRNCSAVTGACLMTRAEVFRALGGFDPDFPLNYNDIDFCLRVQLSGRRVVYTPYAELYHFESATKTGTYAHELEMFKKRWKERWPRDPYFNPNLTIHHPDYRIEADYPPLPGKPVEEI